MDKIILSQSKVLEIYVRNPTDLDSLYSYLEQVTDITSKIFDYCTQNLILTFVECIAHQKIPSTNKLIEESYKTILLGKIKKIFNIQRLNH